MAHYKRKKLFVDPEVQRLLILRVIAYWLACMATLEILRLTWVIASGPEQPTFFAYFVNYDWRDVGGRLLIASVLLVPIVWDMLSFSNRFAGPVFRMRRILRDVAKSGTIEHLRLRNGDYWHGMANDLNAALQRLASSDSRPSPSAVEHEPSVNEGQADPADAEWLADDVASAR
jgi:hypothetical protein